MKTLLLIDANSIIHRCFHALPPLNNKGGRPTQSLYGISSILIKLWRDDRPEYAAALFDRPEPTFRKEKYAEYKAHRSKAPDELISQIIDAHDLFSTFGIRTFEEPGWEADDLIATLARKFGGEKNLKVVILTGDLDTLQLVVGDKVVVRTFRKGLSDTFIYDEAAVKERYNLRPDQIADYKAMVGDASDNIKGIPGVGPKTASDLLNRFGNLNAILKAAEGDPKLQAKFGVAKEQAELSLDLVTLRSFNGLPVKALEDVKVHVDSDAIVAYFSFLGFDSLIDRYLGRTPPPKTKGKTDKSEPPSAPTNTQGTIF